ncbi:MAG: thioredoxin domain-containing protein [Solirubrobacteraceae bacterium]|jgi:protein-disulfide isomerase
MNRPSRKQQRLAAREARLEAERTRTALSRRRRRQRAAIVTVIALGAATAGIVVSSTPPGSAPTAGTVRAVTALLRGIPESGERLGTPDAPVRVAYYGDLECPVCAAFTLSTLPTLVRHDVRIGKVSLSYHSLETATRSPEVFVTQQAAALAAGRQNRLWCYVELFYHEQGIEDTSYVTQHFLTGLARQVPGLNLDEWLQQCKNPALATEVVAEDRAAAAGGLDSTPSLVVTGPHGQQTLVGDVPYTTLEQTISSVA